MDAQPNDILQMFGWPLLGGSNLVAGVYAGDGSLAIDWLNWTVFYGVTKSGQLLVINAVAAALGIGTREGDPFPAGGMVVRIRHKPFPSLGLAIAAVRAGENWPRCFRCQDQLSTEL